MGSLLSLPKARGVILTPGEMAELTPTGLVKTTISNVEQTASWKEGVFYFANKLNNALIPDQLRLVSPPTIVTTFFINPACIKSANSLRVPCQ